MKIFLIALACAWVLLANHGASAAGASACYNVADSDARTYCLARAHREPGQCYSIQRSELRQQCLAEVTR